MTSNLARNNAVDPVAGPLDPLIEEAYKELENSREIARTILLNARHEASQIVDRARKEAKTLVEEAKKQEIEQRGQLSEEAERLGRAAFEKGFDEGKRHGEDEGKRSFETLITRLSSISDYLGRQKREVLRENREEVVELILRISERVLKLEQSSQKDLLAANISLVLDDVSGEETVQIHLNPADFQAVRAHLARHDAPACRPQFSEDSSVPEGECRIRSRSVNLDVSFQKRFQAIRDRLIETLGEDGGV